MNEDVEAASPAVTAVPNALTWRIDNKGFAIMALYESRLHRMITKNKKDLDDLQTKRKAVEAAAREEAELLLTHQLTQHPPLDQAKPFQVNGFGFYPRPASPKEPPAISRRSPLMPRPHWDPTK